MELPEIVSEEEWQASNEALLAKEKEATRARDALAAERRRQPMVGVVGRLRVRGAGREGRSCDLFEGRSQLILYHFWHPPEGEPCSGCSMFTDQIGHLAHIHARDTTLALVSTAPQPQIEAFKQRMGWEMPWYTVVGDEFQKARGTPSTSSSTSTCATATASSSPTATGAAASRRSAASGPSST